MRRVIQGIMTVFLLTVVGCEDVSVSVNRRGEIAFSRQEGVFYLNPKDTSVELVDWTLDTEEVPVIVRWSPDGRYVAYTSRAEDDYYDTAVYVIDRLGRGRRLVYSCEQVILQMEWSADGTYLSISQVGEDTDVGVADLAVVTVATAQSQIVLRNVGDSVAWPVDNTFTFMQITDVNPDNSDILKGSLCVYDVDSGEITQVTETIVSKDGGIAVDPEGVIVFTAISVSETEFTESMTTSSYAYSIEPGKEAERIFDRPVVYLGFSPDMSRLLIELEREISGFDLGYIERASGEWVLLLEQIVESVTVDSVDVALYPAWYGNDAVLYWDLAKTYGMNGQALRLMMLDMTDGSKQNLQPFIDTAIDRFVRERGGY